MKRSWLWRGGFALSTCLIGVLTMLAGEYRAGAQEGQGVYVAQASARLTKLIDKGNKDGYSLQNNAFSIGGGWLKQSKTEWVAIYTLNLKEGKKYRFLAAGDNDAKDVDIEIQNAKGKVVASDTDTDPEAKVDFTPEVSGLYKVRIRLYESKNSVPCVCLSIVMAK